MIKSIQIVFIIAALAVSATPIVSQTKKASTPGVARKEVRQAERARLKSKDDLAKATEEYQDSLKQLLALREKEIKRTSEQSAKLKELYADGIISKRDYEASAEAIVEARARVEDVRQQMKAADELLAEALAEPEIVAAIPTSPAGRSVEHLKRTALIRFHGAGSWFLSGAGQIDSFFASKFGRRLPVSSFGQSELHNRWGFDHSNAMDVGVHPDSIEGQALINYLQNARIPFIAFRRAVPGSATGPHIHVGNPSHRITPR